MNEMIKELLTLSIVFVLLCFFALYKSRKNNQNKTDRAQVLRQIGSIFGVDMSQNSVAEILKSLVKQNLVKKFDKSISDVDFIELAGEQNFTKIPNLKHEKLSEKFINQCVKNLKEPLAMALFALDSQNYALILLESNKINELAELAGALNESIIICD
ncbi:hypothetical protein [Campylobacter suis]|uniref:Uncharacterized protein n=1 Tax=Campylobacter suis TaxID=2790657 RepID=A0ABM8Q979_9BACT|nr:hypothetical protein [Campylobacter suis]CAD7289415.1 hypothetical protein LMG8286_01795 [Campylobacter suis]